MNDDNRKPKPIDVRTIPRDQLMNRAWASALLAHLNQSEDPWLQVTPASVTVWSDALGEYTFGECFDAASRYYNSYDSKAAERKRETLGIGALVHLLKEQRAYLLRVEAAKSPKRPLEPGRRTPMPPHIKAKMNRSLGRTDPTRERHP